MSAKFIQVQQSISRNMSDAVLTPESIPKNTDTRRLAQYACDSCHARKTRCSRDKPICSTCIQWPAECVYSRRGVIHRRPKRRRAKQTTSCDLVKSQESGSHVSSPAEAQQQEHAPADHRPTARNELYHHLDEKLNSIKSVLQTLTSAVTDLELALKRDSSLVPTRSREVFDQDEDESDYEPDDSFYTSRSMTFSGTEYDQTPQSQTEIDMAMLKRRLDSYGIQQSNLSSEITAFNRMYTSFWQDEEFIQMADRTKNNTSQFFSFEDYTKLDLANTFASIVSRGGPVYAAPSQEVLHYIVHEPWKVEEKAWLIMFNGIMLTTLIRTRPGDTDLAPKFKWNIWMALNDAKVLLEPSETNILALTLLAIHVQDFHTPTMSWMLTSTACRMMQAVDAFSRVHSDAAATERRRLLFWYLNMLDKSLALIFGRPPTLQEITSQTMPLPSIATLQSYVPHRPANAAPASDSRNRPEGVIGYGARYLMQSFTLSDIMHDIWRLEPANAREDGVETDASARLEENIRQALDSWLEYTTAQLKIEMAFEPWEEQAQASMRLGIKHMEFQYYYHKILLLRKLAGNHHVPCLKASRCALGLLSGLVSHSDDVYNGIVWQLLYGPVTPFLVVFCEVLRHQAAPETQSDVELLQQACIYYQNMTHQNSQAKQLLSLTRMLVGFVCSVLYGETSQACSASTPGSSKGAQRPAALSTQFVRPRDNVHLAAETDATMSVDQNMYPWPLSAGGLSPLDNFGVGQQINSTLANVNAYMSHAGPPRNLAHPTSVGANVARSQELDTNAMFANWFTW